MSVKILLSLIQSDINRYKATGSSSSFKIIVLYQAFWATCFYRLFHFLYLKTKNSRIFRIFVSIGYHTGYKLIQILTGISIPAGTEIGKGLHLAHFGPILISGGAKLGDYCNLGNQVIIGYGRVKGKPGFPILGNRVFVGPGAKIFGPVKIGNDVAIGANAVVTMDIPDRAVVGGIPAKIINYHGSFSYINYPGRDQDQERLKNWVLASQQYPSLYKDKSFNPTRDEKQ